MPSTITYINEYAFYNCFELASELKIPDSVTKIGSRTFSYCSGLTSVTIPESVTTMVGGAFRSCTGLTSVTIGNGLPEMGGYAFEYWKQQYFSVTNLNLDSDSSRLQR